MSTQKPGTKPGVSGAAFIAALIAMPIATLAVVGGIMHLIMGNTEPGLATLAVGLVALVATTWILTKGLIHPRRPAR